MKLKKLLAAFMACGMLMSFVPTTALAASAGWKGSDSAGWQYCTSDGSYVKNDWKQISGKWYYFGNDGYAFLDTWAFIDGKLYHFGKSGAMDKNKWIICGDHTGYTDAEQGLKDYRYVGSDGAAYTGWKQIGGKWYYFFTNKNFDTANKIYYGLMAYGEVQFDMDTQYYFDRSGQMAVNSWYDTVYSTKYAGPDGKAYSGWHKIEDKWYFFETFDTMPNVLVQRDVIFDHGKAYHKDGSPVTGLYGMSNNRYIYCDKDGTQWINKWLIKDGIWYYFDGQGFMVSNRNDLFIEGKFYNFGSDGKCTNFNSSLSATGWYPQNSNEDNLGPYYIGSDGKAYYSKWLTYNGSKYYFSSNGKKLTDIEDIIGGKLYSFDSTGKCITPNGVTEKGWYNGVYDWFYIGSDGKPCSGWQKIGGKWYYFDESNFGMYANNEKLINGKYYRFTSSGAMKTGWYQDAYTWRYYGSDGARYQSKWVYSGGAWYYFDESHMITDTDFYIIDGRAYNFDAEGKCLNPSGSTFKFD
ncbi:hypothetical protein [Butyrivibrio sp. AE2032]|uniref:hypothetical protein n=1 Tax=Butyrivibrio sp. AE2032 TaxID=1458463 RepID=UPI0005599511|nr:hypothetical protein [Butyrivibrio sp. AE2032]